MSDNPKPKDPKLPARTKDLTSHELATKVMAWVGVTKRVDPEVRQLLTILALLVLPWSAKYQVDSKILDMLDKNT